MINIAVCDDDRPFARSMVRLLHKIAAEQDIQISCDTFFDGSSMVKAAMEEQVCFDLVYLDVETEDMDGIRAALALRDAELPVLIDT